MFSNGNLITDMRELITSDNLKYLETADFSVDDYHDILDQISQETRNNLIIDHSLPVLENIKRITRQHVNIYYSDKETTSGYYIYNKLYLNDNQPESQQIVTLIHELTHHIYAEIFEKVLEKLFNVENYRIIESFVMFMLNNSIENRVADEYLSYLVESFFTPEAYHNYIPFIQLLIEYEINVEECKNLFIFTREISNDIHDILSEVIDEKLEKQIEYQFIRDDIDEFNQTLTFEYANETLSDDEKIEIIREMIYFIFDFFVNGEGDISELIEYIDKFDDKK